MKKRNAALSEMYVTDERDKQFIKKQKLGAATPSPPLPSPEDAASSTTAISIDHTHPMYKLTLEAAAEKFFQTSHVIPAQELNAVLAEHGLVSKKKYKHNFRSTKYGLAVTGELINALAEQEAEKDKLNEAKETAANNRLDKRVKARAAQVTAGEEVLGAHRDGSDAWQNLPVDKLKSAYKFLTGLEVKEIPTSSGGLKKSDVVAAISAHFMQHLEARVDAAADTQSPATPQLGTPQIQAASIATPQELVHLGNELSQQEELEASEMETIILDGSAPARPRRGVKRPRKFND